MTRDADFERFARDCSQGAILALRRMGGATFTESDRRDWRAMGRVTDTERREVARRLRETRVERYNSILSGTHLGEIAGVCAQIVSPHEDQVRAAADRLADLIEPSCDRDALLALADEIEDNDVTYSVSTQYVLDDYARRIREACGERAS